MTTKVTKNPKKVERGKKAYETHIKKTKEEILSSSKSTPSIGDLTPSTPVSTPLTTTSSTPSTPSSTPASTTAITTAAPTTPSFTISSTLLGTGAIAAVIIVAGYFYISRKKPAPAKPADQAPPIKNAAFFHMQ